MSRYCTSGLVVIDPLQSNLVVQFIVLTYYIIRTSQSSIKTLYSITFVIVIIQVYFRQKSIENKTTYIVYINF